MTPLLSIIVPTKNRRLQCIEAVRAVLRYPEPFELVVFDSSDHNALCSELAALTDDRLRYVRAENTTLNMTQCFEAAVLEARGKYVCMIGDDDGIAPALFEWVARSEIEGYTSVTTHPDTYALYNWPDIRSKYFGDQAAGKLFMHIAPVPEAKIANADSAVANFLHAAGQGCANMPRVYHGLIRRDVLDAMRTDFGCCFDGVSPDVSFSYLAALRSNHHVVIRAPLTISGASAVSNAGRSAMRVHKGDLWSDPHMKNFRNEPWPVEVPEFFSVETVWAQATLSAIRRAGGHDLRRFNLSRLYALLLLRHADHFSDILQSLRAACASDTTVPLSWLHFSATLIVATVEHCTAGVAKIARKISGGTRDVSVSNAASIVEASELVRATGVVVR